MKYQTFSDMATDRFEVAILVPKLSAKDMRREYIEAQTLDPTEVIAYELLQQGKKTPATVQREYLDELVPVLGDLGVKYLMVGETEYFKTLCGVRKAEAYLGYAIPNEWPENMAGQFMVFYVPNYRQVFHNPAPTRAKITQAFDALWNHRQGHYRDPGCDIISFAAYPSTPTDIAAWLDKLIKMDVDLTADIETFSLKHHSAGIGTIAFAWNKHEGIAFPVDLSENPEAVRRLLGRFFREFKHKLIWHNISFDAYVLIYQLFMEHICDTAGLLDGLEVMLKNWDDTKLITYLATNSCAGNDLGLKAQSQEFSGNYAVEEIKDIRAIPLPELLLYNLVDALSTWFVREKHWDTMVADNQLEIYETLFKPAIWDIIQMQLTGLPIDLERVKEVKAILEVDHVAALHRIQSHKLTKTLTHMLNDEAEAARYEDWLDRKASGIKVRPYTPSKGDLEFNPNSPQQMQRLLYELAGLPIIEKTATGQAATGKEVLEKLRAETEDPKLLDLIDAFLAYAAVDKILTAFIPAMEGAVLGPDGCHYLFGNFNLGGTVSGRLSSSNPNLQTIPANSKYAKIIKSCFKAPKGWLLVGLDFASLEDRISALTTKDPNKLKVYTDGFDGHSLRAQSYFSEQMPDIELAPEGARCFEAKIGDRTIWFHEQEQVSYLGQDMTGLELWERLMNVRVAA
jgi:DNA polymerase-1